MQSNDICSKQICIWKENEGIYSWLSIFKINSIKILGLVKRNIFLLQTQCSDVYCFFGPSVVLSLLAIFLVFPYDHQAKADPTTDKQEGLAH